MTLSKFLDPKNDVAFKKVFGTNKNKDVLIHFINDVLELKGKNQIKTVDFLSPIQDPVIAGKKQSIVDVLCEDENKVKFIVEMQICPTRGFEKRAQYYAAKAYSRQIESGSKKGARYQDLKKVIFIAITDCILFKKKKAYKSNHIILDKESYEHDLQDFSFTFIELPKFEKTKIEDLDTIIEKWCYFFKYADQTNPEELEKIIGSDQVIQKAYEALKEFNWTEKELMAYEAARKVILDNLAALDYQYCKGKEEGIEQGIEQEKITIAKKMLEQNLEYSVIMSVTSLTEEKINQIKQKNEEK